MLNYQRVTGTGMMKMLNYPQKNLVLVHCSQQKPSGPRPQRTQRTLADQGRVDACSLRCERIREQFAPRAAVIPTFTAFGSSILQFSLQFH